MDNQTETSPVSVITPDFSSQNLCFVDMADDPLNAPETIGAASGGGASTRVGPVLAGIDTLIGWARGDLAADADSRMSPFAFCAGMTCRDGRENPFDATTERLLFDEWDAGLAVRIAEALTPAARVLK